MKKDINNYFLSMMLFIITSIFFISYKPESKIEVFIYFLVTIFYLFLSSAYFLNIYEAFEKCGHQ